MLLKNCAYFIFTIFLVITVRCASINEEIKYAVNEKYTVQSVACPKSVDLIDRFETHEFYITIKKSEQCIKFDLIGFLPSESIAGGEEQVPIFWIFDRIVHGTGKHAVYSEIIRNFDSEWRSLSTTQICSSIEKPLEQLDPGLYRMRITIFKLSPYRIEFGISSNEPIFVSTYKPEVR
jgi:hypothetical protein